MMNLVSLCLVFTSLAAAAIWSPPPQQKVQINKHNEVIVKEGYRSVEIEYEEDDGSTRIKVSPHEKVLDSDSSSGKVQEGIESMKEKWDEKKDAFGECKDKVQEGVESTKEKLDEKRRSSRDLVCDAFGECKHRVASAFGKSTRVLSGKAHEAKHAVEEGLGNVKDEAQHLSGKANEVKDEAKHAVEERLGKVKDAVSGSYHDAQAKAQNLADKPREIKEKVKGAARDAAQTSEEKLKGAFETGKTIEEDLRHNFTEELEIANETIVKTSFNFRRYVAGSLRLLGFSMAYGTAAWVTFISSYIMSDALPRQQFAVVQGKLYPVYFRFMAYGIGVVLFTHFLSWGKGANDFIQAINLFTSLLAVLVNLNYLEPRANKIMIEKMKLEKEEGRGISPLGGKASGAGASLNFSSENSQGRADSNATAAAMSKMVRLNEKLKKLNSASSFLNLITLMSLSWYLFHLGQMIQA